MGLDKTIIILRSLSPAQVDYELQVKVEGIRNSQFNNILNPVQTEQTQSLGSSGAYRGDNQTEFIRWAKFPINRSHLPGISRKQYQWSQMHLVYWSLRN